MVDALWGSLFLYVLTTLGAAFIFIKGSGIFAKTNYMLAFAGGIMLASSFFSLLQPSVELSLKLNMPTWIPPVGGFLAGLLFIYGLDKLLPHIHQIGANTVDEGLKISIQRSWLFIFAIAIHNIPEGLSVGISYASSDYYHLSKGAPFALALGIGIQDIPEGLAIALPLLVLNYSRQRAFFIGQLSGLIEFLASFLGFLLVRELAFLLPFALSFAAGAMIYVIVEEVIPEAQQGKHDDRVTLIFFIGFILMMILDLTL